jgi:alkaline phosphatase
MVKNTKLMWLLFAGLSIQSVSAQQKLTANAGHSHNDYKQQIPLLEAYYAAMGSFTLPMKAAKSNQGRR